MSLQKFRYKNFAAFLRENCNSIKKIFIMCIYVPSLYFSGGKCFGVCTVCGLKNISCPDCGCYYKRFHLERVVYSSGDLVGFHSNNVNSA